MISEFQAGAAATTQTSKQIDDAHTVAATLTSAGIDTYHLSTWTSDDFYGDTTETVLLLKVQQPGASPGTSSAILTAVKQTGDTRVPGGLVSWVAIGAPAVGGAALNGVVQIRSDPDHLSKFSWAKCVVQLLTPSRIVVTMPVRRNLDSLSMFTNLTQDLDTQYCSFWGLHRASDTPEASR